MYHRRQGLPVDEAALAQAMSEVSAKLDVYEVILAKQKFLGGDVSLFLDPKLTMQSDAPCVGIHAG